MVAVRGPVSALSVIALTLFPTLSHALPSAAFVDSGRGPPKGYTEVEMKWDIVVDRQNHPNVTTTFNGTIESAMRQAQALNPDFFTQVGIDADQFNANEPPVMLSHEKTKTASKTVDFPFPFNIQTAISCFDKMTGWHGASSAGIEQQIKYLRGVPGHPRLSPGPSECVRVSCSWNDAVWWCNDNLKSKTLFSYDLIADGAATIVDECRMPYYEGGKVDEPWSLYLTTGQVWYLDNWNVVVKWDKC